MNLTLPTKSTRAWERLRDGTTAKLRRSLPRGKKARAAAVERGATVPLIDRKAIAEEMKRRHGE